VGNGAYPISLGELMCRICGNIIDSSFDFCPYCGSKVLSNKINLLRINYGTYIRKFRRLIQRIFISANGYEYWVSFFE
jgi:hypothetical protein